MALRVELVLRFDRRAALRGVCCCFPLGYVIIKRGRDPETWSSDMSDASSFSLSFFFSFCLSIGILIFENKTRDLLV